MRPFDTNDDDTTMGPGPYGPAWALAGRGRRPRRGRGGFGPGGPGFGPGPDGYENSGGPGAPGFAGPGGPGGFGGGAQRGHGRGGHGGHGGGPGGHGRGRDFGDFAGFGGLGGAGEWAPWRAGRRMRRGDIRVALLAALLDGPAHGYELIRRLEQRSGGWWRPSAGSVYPTLQLLEEEGLLTSREEDGKRVYDLTEEGRTAAEKARERGPLGPDEPSAQWEMRGALRTLVMAFRQVAVAGDEAQVSAAVRILTDARQQLYRVLAGESSVPEGDPTGGDGRSSEVQTDEESEAAPGAEA